MLLCLFKRVLSFFKAFLGNARPTFEAYFQETDRWRWDSLEYNICFEKALSIENCKEIRGPMFCFVFVLRIPVLFVKAVCGVPILFVKALS